MNKLVFTLYKEYNEIAYNRLNEKVISGEFQKDVVSSNKEIRSCKASMRHDDKYMYATICLSVTTSIDDIKDELRESDLFGSMKSVYINNKVWINRKLDEPPFAESASGEG